MLHTADLARARAFSAEVCGWRTPQLDTGAGSYLAFELADTLGGGVVECPVERPPWLPYVRVAEIGR